MAALQRDRKGQLFDETARAGGGTHGVAELQGMIHQRPSPRGRQGDDAGIPHFGPTVEGHAGQCLAHQGTAHLGKRAAVAVRQRILPTVHESLPGIQSGVQGRQVRGQEGVGIDIDQMLVRMALQGVFDGLDLDAPEELLRPLPVLQGVGGDGKHLDDRAGDPCWLVNCLHVDHFLRMGHFLCTGHALCTGRAAYAGRALCTGRAPLTALVRRPLLSFLPCRHTCLQPAIETGPVGHDQHAPDAWILQKAENAEGRLVVVFGPVAKGEQKQIHGGVVEEHKQRAPMIGDCSVIRGARRPVRMDSGA